MTDSQIVSEGLVVFIQFKLTKDDGSFIDASREDEPLDYLHGKG